MSLSRSSSTSSSSTEEEQEEEVASLSSASTDGDVTIKLSLFQSALSVIPFTPYWWEARRAYEAANNLRRMQEETARARHLVSLCEKGLYEEALSEHAKDADLSEFTQFNKIKHDMDKAAGAATSPEKRNVSTPLVIAKRPRTTSARKEAARAAMQCRWRCETDDGRQTILRCRNERMWHPTRRVTDTCGALVPDLLKYCAYHADVCVGTHERQTIQAVTIPNELALCNYCYLRAVSKAPKRLRQVPGVYVDVSTSSNRRKRNWAERAADNARRELREAVVEQALERRAATPHTETTVCTWIPDKSVPRERGLACTNLVLKTGDDTFLPFCGWHATRCIRAHHAREEDAIILIPNAYGLCRSHYAREQRRRPIDIGWPLPGMERVDETFSLVEPIEESDSDRRKVKSTQRGGRKDNTSANAVTWNDDFNTGPACDGYATPKHASLDGPWNQRRSCLPACCIHLFASRRKEKMQAEKIVLIQKHFRKFVACREMQRLREVRQRTRAATKTQAVIRSYFGRIKARSDATVKLRALSTLQRFVRGSMARKRCFRYQASLNLQRAGVALHRRMLQTATIELQQRRRARWIERRAEKRIQRIILGAIGRFRYAAARKERDEQCVMQSRISNVWRGHAHRTHARRASESYVRAIDANTKLQSVWRMKMVRRALNPKLRRRKKALQLAQRVMRGAICRLRAARRRQQVADAWRYLIGPVSLERRAALENLLPKARYITSTVESPTSPDSEVVDTVDKRRDTWFEASDAKYFEKYDDIGTGQLSRYDFRKAMRALWESKGLVITERELEPFVTRFDEFSDGNVRWQHFLNFARLSYRPCSRHRRIVCADCVTRGPCRRFGCACDKFTTARGECMKKTTTCSSCNHTPVTHMLVPACCVEESDSEPEDEATMSRLVSAEKLTDIFENRDLGASDRIAKHIGIRIETTLVDRKEDTHKEEVLCPCDEKKAEVEKKTTTKMNTGFDEFAQKALCVPRRRRTKKPGHGLPISIRDSVIPAAERAEISTHVKSVFEPNETIRESLTVAESEGGVDHDVAQSKEELERGFKITRPIPLIVANEFRWTVKVAELYIDLLKRLSDEALYRDAQHKELKQLVFQNDVFFERHWKKLVRDLRSGKLNRHVPISIDQRRDFESRSYPKPRQADDLDRALKSLGFHVRSSTLPVFSQSKVLPTVDEERPTLSNEASLGAPRQKLARDEMDTMVVTDFPKKKRRGSANDVVGAALHEKDLIHRASYELKTLPRPKNGDSFIRKQPRNTRPFVCPHPGCGESFSNRGICEKHFDVEHAGRKRLAVATPDQDQFLSRYWPSDGVPWQRDASIVGSVENYLSLVCPICGLALRTKPDLRRHLVIGHRKDALKKCLNEMLFEEEDEQSLSTSSWNSRWRRRRSSSYCSTDRVRRISLSSTSGRRRSSTDSSTLSVGESVISGSYGQQKAKADFKGHKPLLCPPFAPPLRAPLPFCMQHARSSFRCLQCAEARKLKGPKPPLKFAQKVIVSPEECGSTSSKTTSRADSTFMVQSERVPLVLDVQNRVRPAQLLSVCLDGDEAVWVGVGLMFSYQELLKMNKKVAPNNIPADGVDKNHEVFEDVVATYMRAERIVGHSYVLSCTKEEFHSRRKCGALPEKGSRPVKYSRFAVDAHTCTIGPPRILDSNVPVLGTFSNKPFDIIVT